MKHEYYKHNTLRFEKSAAKFKAAYEFKPSNSIPKIIMDVNYALFGFRPDCMPDDYFSNPEAMLDYQCKKIERHLASIDDDYIPMFMPWYGTGVVPSALGSQIVFNKGLDPAVHGRILIDPSDLHRLRLPDPCQDGQMPDVLRCIDHARTHSDLPISVTDCQGPLNIALSLCGVEDFCLWMYDDPEKVHDIMDFCTEVLINWIKVQKKHAGQELDSGAWPHSILLPKGYGGVSIADDDAVVLSPDLYREFVVPYNSRIFKAFGGGTLHFCGNAEHQLDNFEQMDGLTGINNFCMGNFKQLIKMQKKFKNKYTLMACDFNPLHIESYYSELLNCLDPEGLIVCCFVTPELALDEGKYVAAAKDELEIIHDLKKALSL